MLILRCRLGASDLLPVGSSEARAAGKVVLATAEAADVATRVPVGLGGTEDTDNGEEKSEE